MLNQYGAHIEDRAEILIMDYINGKDLGTTMYDHVLTKLGYESDSLAVMSYSEKEQEVGKAIGFEQPDLSSSTQEELDSARALTFARNEVKLLKYLKKDGFVLDPTILTAIENTIRLLHQNGLYHNDLHKQNVMIGEDGRVYLIDFGRADTQKREKCIDDSALIQTWRPLATTEEAERQQKTEQIRKSFESIARRMKGSSAYQEKLGQLVKDIDTEGSTALEKALTRARSSDGALEHFFISLSILLEESSDQRDTIASFIASLSTRDRKWRSADLNMLHRFRESGIWD
jgi:tRNA A-37 threonylcarbamoyl transferase component Bud32